MRPSEYKPPCDAVANRGSGLASAAKLDRKMPEVAAASGSSELNFGSEVDKALLNAIGSTDTTALSTPEAMSMVADIEPSECILTDSGTMEAVMPADEVVDTSGYSET